MAKTREYACDPLVLAALGSSYEDGDELYEVAEIVTLRARLRDMVREAIDSLEEPWRSVLEWRYYERVSFEEIASRLGSIDRSSALRRHRNALDMLKDALEGVGCRKIWEQYCSVARPATTSHRSHT